MKMLALVSTCGKCAAPIRKTFSALAYEKGVVLVTCDGCGVKHLVADHLGWTADHSTVGSKPHVDLSTLYGDRLQRGTLSPSSIADDGQIDVALSEGLVDGLTREEARELFVKATRRKH